MLRSVSVITLGLLALGAAQPAQAPPAASFKPFGQSPLIAFYGSHPGLRSQTFAHGGDWKYWQSRNGVAAVGITHQKFLRKSVDDAVEVLAGLDFGASPNPVVDIDEFGWDFDGG